MNLVNNKNISKTLLISAIILGAVSSFQAHAEGGSVHHSGQASKHTVLAIAEGSKTSVKVASAVVAAPIILSGAVSTALGEKALKVGESIASSGQNISVHQHHQLVVTDIVITADPAPNQVHQAKEEEQTERQVTHKTSKTVTTEEVTTTSRKQ